MAHALGLLVLLLEHRLAVPKRAHEHLRAVIVLHGLEDSRLLDLQQLTEREVLTRVDALLGHRPTSFLRRACGRIARRVLAKLEIDGELLVLARRIYDVVVDGGRRWRILV